MHPQPESPIQPTQAVQAPPESGDTSMDPQGLPNPTSTAAGVLRHNSEVMNNDLSTEADENGSEQDYPSDDSMSPNPTTSHPPHPNGFNSPCISHPRTWLYAEPNGTRSHFRAKHDTGIVIGYNEW
ncbi:hypothetical protein ONZ45_g11853 [Pleurotus djamor]|nr:hypothetical protein ONZ45_g11853 [Pleurotus djamor]